MIGEFEKTMSHDVIEVDIPTILGEKGLPKQPDPLLQLLRRIKDSASIKMAIFFGEIPHSSFETAYDIPHKPTRSLAERMRVLVPVNLRLHRLTQ